MIRKIYISAMFMIGGIALNGQNVNKQIILYFDTKHYTFSKDQIDSLNNFLKSNIPDLNISSICVIGHTDNAGDSLYNIELSRKRAQSASEFLLSVYNNKEILKTEWYGENKPLNGNRNKSEKAVNRRVEIILTGIPKTKEVSLQIKNIDSLFNKLQHPEQHYCINPLKDTVIKCDDGTLISVGANTFILNSDKCVEIRVKEAFTIQDMLSYHLNTLSNDKPLVSLGMFSILAFQDNKPIQIREEKPLKVIVPSDNINSAMLSFSGQIIMPDSLINWQLSDSAGTFYLNNFNLCPKNWQDQLIPCKLFFCKIREFLFPNSRKVNERKAFNQQLTDECIKQEQLMNNFKKRFGDTNAKKIEELMEEKNQYSAYIFNISNLGWTNLDYFLSFDSAKLTTVKLITDPDITSETRIVFKNLKVILPGNTIKDGYEFSSVPVGEPVYIITIRGEKDGYGFSFEDTIIHENQMIKPDFQKVDAKYIKEKLEQL